ncbi:chemotaxis protein CheC [Pseudoalteromonas denitrificans]|uniref:Chemotaxis protein CheC n=1 Tax=Pseudoalteromonas denitrificans DSM 6059 TaxID=1123010 RepID=A0A1I1LIM8_9GAMM|nr:chemotaxis protein CheC [Pseudoalteromonas denitrificans]SFC72402.1 chemotaxis protein CheC [Pseudoalteromonas denitrificans DSM 6059]
MNEANLLNDLEQDFLVELFNLGIGKAADSLSQIVNQEILLSVPDVEYISLETLNEKMGGHKEICSVSQSVKGQFCANSMLLFPEQSSLEVVKKMLGDQYSDETIVELHQEGFTEIGNIVLNACIGSLAQSFDAEFKVGLPFYQIGSADDVLQAPDQENILFIRINLVLSESKVEGYLIFLLEQLSFSKFKGMLNQMIKGLLSK